MTFSSPVSIYKDSNNMYYKHNQLRNQIKSMQEDIEETIKKICWDHDHINHEDITVSFTNYSVMIKLSDYIKISASSIFVIDRFMGIKGMISIIDEHIYIVYDERSIPITQSTLDL